MVEISFVKNLQILHYKWKYYKWNYISDLTQECKELELYRTTINFNSINISDFCQGIWRTPVFIVNFVCREIKYE